MVLNEWSKWEANRWARNGYRYERTRTVRSWFGYLRQEKEQVILPYLSNGIGEALLNGANYAYGEVLEAWRKEREEQRQALIAAREAHHKAVMEISALKQSLESMNSVAAQAIRSLEAKEQECEQLRALNRIQGGLIGRLRRQTTDVPEPAKPAKRRARRA